ncbi:OmpA family protein [Neolewinella xylanilytica]|uniref:OmpA family protein n=1 Tax=Neolewinella xylanilytica TaxID=1514080 RepID=UPI00147542DE|nr:OmpA family protein [Neolewinella xylanilytica]
MALILFGSRSVFGQSRDRLRAVEAFDDGMQYILDGKLSRAAKRLQQAADYDPTFLPGVRSLGTVCGLQKDFDCAIESYRTVLEADSTFSRLLYFQLGEAYLQAGDARQALDYFQRFQALQDRDRGAFGLMGDQEMATEQRIVDQDLDRSILSAQISADSTNYVNATNLLNMGAPINSEDNDYFPFFTNDLTGVLYTRQESRGDEDLITAKRRGTTGKFRTSRFGTFNTQQPEGMCTLVRDGETIFFTLCHENEGGGGCDIHSGVLIDGRIEHTEQLPNYLNSPTWDSQAAISCDGRQLFFASTRPGGIGGSDLYRCYRLPDGSWSEPINLGAGVNTPYDEEAPFLSNDAETLYFSSMGHESLGDQDIFYSRWDPSRERWSKAMNIGPPVNSPARELGFHLSADGRQGFFASDRAGGMGGLDIYSFTLNEELTGKEVTYVSGFVTDSLTGEPIANQEVPVAGGDVFRTNYAGRFFICAPPDAPLTLQVDNAAYDPYRHTFSIPRWDNTTPYRINLPLTKSGAPPPPEPEVKPRETYTETLQALFAFEEYELTSEQQSALRVFADSLDRERIASIALIGFTDETGAVDYNMRLSQNRAEAVGAYLRKLGINPALIVIEEGKGEIAGQREKKLNRRVDIVVTMYGG